ncbi:hypothetical protein [Actinomadura fibrosa]|uniref:Uncharacterized protein n=1 Tax=Actinomadura fibrosa TaxID=111802 RepID=A0ABW2XD14_9ACTN|nr:hypothetical protein [Actinomadura fibrosa]
MLQVTNGSGEVVKVSKVEQLVALIPGETMTSLREQVGDAGTLNDYLDLFIGQGRKTTSARLGADVSMAVRIMHWKDAGELPGTRGGGDLVMFHYVTPEPQVAGGKGSAQLAAAQEASVYAQNQLRFNGKQMLRVYSAYTNFFKKYALDGADQGRLTRFGEEAWAGRSVDPSSPDTLVDALGKAADGQPFMMSFIYGAHQVYMRFSYEGGSYRLEYFDRQRQTLTLKGREIPGYLRGEETADARPMYFIFGIEPKELATLCAEAQALAAKQIVNPGETLVNGPRKSVLEKLAAKATDVGVFGDPEPAQHPDAINCPWASLESAIRHFVGPEPLQRQVGFIREVGVTLYIADSGSPVEREAAGLMAAE